MHDETSAGAWHRVHRSVAQRTAHLSPTAKGLLWTTAAGLQFSVLNAIARELTLRIDPFQSQFLRYGFGLFVLLPIVWHRGVATYRPKNVTGQFTRGAVHTLGLCLWYVALPKIPLADLTAIGFTGPIFIMIGAYVFFREPMHWDRWLATVLGFVGVLIVVGPKVSGSGGHFHLLMLASAPVFAASFLMTKALTRHESAGVILLWQSIAISLFSLPLALPVWQWLTAWEWVGFLACGVLGSSRSPTSRRPSRSSSSISSGLRCWAGSCSRRCPVRRHWPVVC
jgi:drug/metabolite transporter (DMT)-like permease